MDLIQSFANWLGLDPATLALLVPLVIIVCNLLGRWIPDTATGPLGTIRKIVKVVGLYLSNRIGSNVTVNDAARLVTGTPSPAEVANGAVETSSQAKVQSPWLVTLGVFVLMAVIVGLSGCAALKTGLGDVGDFVCTHQAQVRVSANTALDQAQQITDPTRKAIAIAAAETLLNSLDACPVEPTQAPLTTQPEAPAPAAASGV